MDVSNRSSATFGGGALEVDLIEVEACCAWLRYQAPSESLTRDTFCNCEIRNTHLLDLKGICGFP